jgi:hypothetical protein
MQPSAPMSASNSPMIRWSAASATAWTCSAMPAAAHCLSRRRIVASEQARLAMRS